MTLDQIILFLRTYLIDFDTENRLLKFTKESSDDQIRFYLEMALSKLNMVQPFLGVMYDLTSFPFTALLIHSAALECLISNGIVQARNTLDYNNSGISVKIADGSRYNNQLQILTQQIAQELDMYKQTKISQNIMGGYGCSPSPYAYLSGGVIRC